MRKPLPKVCGRAPAYSSVDENEIIIEKNPEESPIIFNKAEETTPLHESDSEALSINAPTVVKKPLSIEDKFALQKVGSSILVEFRYSELL